MAELVQRLASGDMFYVAVLLAVFAAVICLALGVRYLVASRTDVVQDRLRRTVGFPPAIERGGELVHGERSLWQSALEPIANVARPSDAVELGRLRGRLSNAGLRNERALIHYLSAKVILGVLFAVGFLWFNSVRPQPFTHAAFFTIASMAGGFYLPSLWLISRIQDRQRQVNHALPNALDLLVTCVEAGLGLEAAINRVADELQLSASLLSSELAQTSMEMRAGVSRGEAFRRLAERTGVEELRSLSAIIIQTQAFGTSVAKSLRVQADAMRVRRMQLAEERAAAASVKMAIPLVLCITPALFAVLLGPAAVKIYRILLPTLTGGG